MIICFGLKAVNGTKKAREVAVCGRAKAQARRCIVSHAGGCVEGLTSPSGFITSLPEGGTGADSLRYLERDRHFSWRRLQTDGNGGLI